MFTATGTIDSVNTLLVPGASLAQGVFIEMFLTAELVFVVLMLAAEKSKDTFLAPIGIGLALFVAELAGESPPSTLTQSSVEDMEPCIICRASTNSGVGVLYTGGSLNPGESPNQSLIEDMRN